jgi:hypothetical protein
MSEQYNNPGNKKIINPYSPLDTYNRGPCGVGIQAPTWVGIQNMFTRYTIPGHPYTVYRTMCACNKKPFNYNVNDDKCPELLNIKNKKNIDYGFNKSIK